MLYRYCPLGQVFQYLNRVTSPGPIDSGASLAVVGGIGRRLAVWCGVFRQSPREAD